MWFGLVSFGLVLVWFSFELVWFELVRFDSLQFGLVWLVSLCFV